MLWTMVFAVSAGAMLGLWLRVPALILASSVTVIACGIVAPLAEWSIITAAVYVLSALTALQAGYLAGAICGGCARR